MSYKNDPRKRFPFLFALALSFTGLLSPIHAGSFAVHFYPWSAVKGRDGNFYGSMLQGGVPGGCTYTLSAEGKMDRLLRFPNLSYHPQLHPFGSIPEGALSVGQDGAIYGSTRSGGVFGSGVLFKIDPKTGVHRILHHYDTTSFYKGQVFAAENGDVFAIHDQPGLLRLSKDGRHTTIPLNGQAVALTETNDHKIIVASAVYGGGDPNGRLWVLDSNDILQPLTDVAGFPVQLLPLANGNVLCVTFTQIIEISPSGETSPIHEFNIPFEGLTPYSIFVAKDGSYIGSTRSGGLENHGTVFRIIPGSNQFTVLSHLPAPGIRGPGVKWMDRVFPLRVAAEAGNLPPMARDDIMADHKLKPGVDGRPRAIVPVLKNDVDADNDPLFIVSVSSAEHGVVAFDFVTQTITYTANSATVENDTFTYTIVDGSGGTSVGHVFIRGKSAGLYRGAVSSPAQPESGDPGTDAGTLTLRVHGNRTAVGRLELLGKTYRFTAPINEVNKFGAVLASNPRLGTSLGIQVWMRSNGSTWSLEATIIKNGLPFSATCTPVE